MASEINGIPATAASLMTTKVAPQSQSEPREVRRAEQPSAASQADRVSLTAAAVSLSRAEGASNGQPVFDTARVDSLRQQIANGTYQVNASRVADKMQGFESALANHAKGPGVSP